MSEKEINMSRNLLIGVADYGQVLKELQFDSQSQD